MAKCLNCQIEVLDDVESCPLCRAILEPTEEVENMYPNVRSHIQHMTFYLRVYLFCAILLGGGDGKYGGDAVAAGPGFGQQDDEAGQLDQLDQNL